jgi:hypothetical protein
MNVATAQPHTWLPPLAAIVGHHALKLVLVAFGVMFLVSLVAILVCKFTLPSDRGRGN